MTLKGLSIDSYVGYALSAVFFAFGLLVVFGLVIPEGVPKQFRITLGVVLLLWGLYRLVLTRTKSIQQKEDEK